MIDWLSELRKIIENKDQEYNKAKEKSKSRKIEIIDFYTNIGLPAILDLKLVLEEYNRKVEIVKEEETLTMRVNYMNKIECEYSLNFDSSSDKAILTTDSNLPSDYLDKISQIKKEDIYKGFTAKYREIPKSGWLIS
jgi:hypothetical protein